MSAPAETFPALGEIAGVRHAFLCRVPGLDVTADRETALSRLERYHADARERLGFNGASFIHGEQVHGREVAVVDAATAAPVRGVDGFVTNRRGVCLGIYVADCCAVYLVDPVKQAIGLLHSGKKGTDLGIARVAIACMREHFATDPGDLLVQLGPCIGPPHYEVDFAQDIVRQCREAGVSRVFASNANTAAELERYYSYRMEKGKTGRMLALLALV